MPFESLDRALPFRLGLGQHLALFESQQFCVRFDAIPHKSGYSHKDRAACARWALFPVRPGMFGSFEGTPDIFNAGTND